MLVVILHVTLDVWFDRHNFQMSGISLSGVLLHCFIWFCFSVLCSFRDHETNCKSTVHTYMYDNIMIHACVNSSSVDVVFKGTLPDPHAYSACTMLFNKPTMQHSYSLILN